jgi:hypothetical protein
VAPRRKVHHSNTRSLGLIPARSIDIVHACVFVVILTLGLSADLEMLQNIKHIK